ncbi:hypothetical protein CEXT_734411 [Caerostris extrusa]|uniref:Uncharacterized protein n=1 Tax=Caerostris extrusa TaxID=172846 RepID=A0AAV4XJN3_CAEEX|nr:hypothetical protein CEXT_734411 [Caerostris extrusa]
MLLESSEMEASTNTIEHLAWKLNNSPSSYLRFYLFCSPSQVPPAPDNPISGNCTLVCPIYEAIFPDELFAFTLNSKPWEILIKVCVMKTLIRLRVRRNKIYGVARKYPLSSTTCVPIFKGSIILKCFDRKLLPRNCESIAEEKQLLLILR